MIPELVRNPLPAMKQARVAPFVPETKPLEALATILARIATNDDVPVSKAREFAHEMTLKNQDEQFDGLRRIAHALPDIARSPLVILVDQFEEIYSLCDDAEERRIFIENLIYAAKDRAARIFVVITLRSDFLGQTQTHPELSRIIAEKGVIVPAMNETELRRAITEPAQNAKSPMNPAVADLLIEQAKDHEGVLPLLEFALTQIWEGMKKGVDSIKTLTEIRGVGGALANKAQEIYAALGEKEKRIAKRAFLAMIKLGEGTKDTRRRVPICEMAAYDETPEMVHQVLMEFAKPGARLITLSSDLTPRPPSLEGKGEKTDSRETPLSVSGRGWGWGYAEITHEALFDHWLMLKEWLSKSRDDIRFERKLSEAANAWNESGKAAGLLWWQSPNLDLLEKFYQKNQSEFTALQMAFYRASVRKDRMTKLINRGIISVLVMLTGFSVWGDFRARSERDRMFKRQIDALEMANNSGMQAYLGAYIAGFERCKQRLVADNLQVQRDSMFIYWRIGDVQSALKNPKAALQYYQQALSIAETLAADKLNKQAQDEFAALKGIVESLK
ncbi:MAG TPA: hypothetical protein DCQ37_25165 [Desulfobacteraceae bacterium]|nr:hypothetical protein [Desulfobacteraceae bacterium]